MPVFVEQFDLTDYEAVISSQHCVAHGVLTRPDQLHISYVHSPARYAWDLQHQYLAEANLTKGIFSHISRAILHYIRMWDRLAADRVDFFAANSNFIAQRVRKCYRRDAVVIYPPVAVNDFPAVQEKEEYYLAASRFVPYKKIPLIVEAFGRMPDRKLIVIGDGPEFAKAEQRARPNVTLMGYQPFEVLRSHMQRAKAFVFAAEEDFGIMPVEVQACGTPVIAFGRGGVTEIVLEDQTGLFFQNQTVDSIIEAVGRFETRSAPWDASLISQNAQRFSPERFSLEFLSFLDQCHQRFRDKAARPWKAPLPR
jgi:glycosyltransferase involved in cell wall biosynthesis